MSLRVIGQTTPFIPPNFVSQGKQTSKGDNRLTLGCHLFCLLFCLVATIFWRKRYNQKVCFFFGGNSIQQLSKYPIQKKHMIPTPKAELTLRTRKPETKKTMGGSSVCFYVFVPVACGFSDGNQKSTERSP